ncbi:flagellar hook-basal body complex protein [Hellea sp.]|nr:flagellar hook-basal body complex protein [Hellea sp.]
MDNPSYIGLSRQSGLLKELSVIANNMANADTTGYKREGAIFTEFVKAAGASQPSGSLRESMSMGRLGAHVSHFESGELRRTGGSLDVAIDGEGFFLVETPQGERLSRAGHFMTDSEGTLINATGFAILDDAGGRIQIPQEVNLLAIGGDGTLSADGVELGRLGIVTAIPQDLSREGDNLWSAANGYVPVEEPQVIQGFLEDSNVQPVAEIARMIEVQRAYDAGQKLLEIENDRIKSVITTVRQLT